MGRAEPTLSGREGDISVPGPRRKRRAAEQQDPMPGLGCSPLG